MHKYKGSVQPVIIMPGGGDARSTYREGRVGIDLILGRDAKAGVAVAGGPGQVDPRLQLIVHFLVDGATELCSIIPVNLKHIFLSIKCSFIKYTISLNHITAKQQFDYTSIPKESSIWTTFQSTEIHKRENVHRVSPLTDIWSSLRINLVNKTSYLSSVCISNKSSMF